MNVNIVGLDQVPDNKEIFSLDNISVVFGKIQRIENSFSDEEWYAEEEIMEDMAYTSQEFYNLTEFLKECDYDEDSHFVSYSNRLILEINVKDKVVEIKIKSNSRQWYELYSLAEVQEDFKYELCLKEKRYYTTKSARR